MVYTALQFITRGRDQGISVVDLGKKTKYDQKTCFYLVKQLMDLDLMQVLHYAFRWVSLTQLYFKCKEEEIGRWNQFCDSQVLL